jgi:hypothetical protein
VQQLELAFFELANFIRNPKPLQDNFIHYDLQMSTLRIEAKSLEPILAYVQSRAAQRRKSLGAPPTMLMLPIELFGHYNTQDVSFRSRRSCRILPS